MKHEIRASGQTTSVPRISHGVFTRKRRKQDRRERSRAEEGPGPLSSELGARGGHRRRPGPSSADHAISSTCSSLGTQRPWDRVRPAAPRTGPTTLAAFALEPPQAALQAPGSFRLRCPFFPACPGLPAGLRCAAHPWRCFLGALHRERGSFLATLQRLVWSRQCLLCTQSELLSKRRALIHSFIHSPDTHLLNI